MERGNRAFIFHVWSVVLFVALQTGWCPELHAAETGSANSITGVVQNQDLRRVAQAVVELKDQDGVVVETAVTDESGEFSIPVPATGTYSISAVQDAYRSEYLVLVLGTDPPKPVLLTLSKTNEIALEVVSALPPIQYKASSETYQVTRKDIEALPRGNNNDAYEVLLTVPSVAYGALKQTHIRQDHANQQYRIDGIPIPDSVSGSFADIVPPRAWERADIILGGMEAQYGNKTALVVDITSKSGTKPGFGSVQMFGGSNQTVNPSFEYGGTVGEKVRFYILNSYVTTSRGIEPPTLGQTNEHNQSEKNNTYLRGDYQYDNHNNFSWIFLNSVAKYQIPTIPNLEANPDVLALLPAGFAPSASQSVDQYQKENNQYTQLVWRHDLNASSFFSVGAYFRRGLADFHTDALNALAYSDDVGGAQTANQKRSAYTGGIRLDHTWIPNHQHVVKSGMQIDYSRANNTAQVFAFDTGGGAPAGPVVTREASNQNIQTRQEFWLQDQWSLNEHWTFNVGVRGDAIQGFYNEGQVSPRIGATYKLNQSNAFHAYYGRLFTPPNVEQIAFLGLNVQDTTAQPENPTGFRPRAERSHYFEVGSYHAIGKHATLELTGYYKLAHYLSDAGQFGSTPMLNFFAFERGWQRGIDGALKVQLTDNLYGRGNVAWGQCKGYGLQSGQYLLEQAEIDDINSKGGVFCDHSQFMTSSAVLSYRLWDRTNISGQMLYGSGLRTAEEGAKTNSSHEDSYTVYNASITHTIPLPWYGQKMLLGFDLINMFDQKYFYNRGEGSIGLGIAHAGMPRSYFFRAQWFF
ncbi:putative TonB-dependent siderophore receptor [Nitrospira sp. KM1]|uniref:TonB-dependent receptor n=1 Tax=Nitrospira sp. KM1 TaxID=1936990 RepID=UPI0013A75FB6|nr:TonB-dependent receptor [Nitrospira sp. KM1]BCA54177.1 putative TonB-dependent siderophore receptor [Nitrospira sp. KM1]